MAFRKVLEKKICRKRLSSFFCQQQLFQRCQLFITDRELLKRNIFKMLFDLKKACVQRLKFKVAFFHSSREQVYWRIKANNYVVFHRSVVVKLHVVTEDFMSENYKCLFHKIIFHFFIPRVFPFVSGWFFPSCLDWSGNYSNYAEYTIQLLDRLDLKFSVTLKDRIFQP